MTTAITSIFTLLGNCWTVIMGNPLLSVAVGLSIATLIFGVLMFIISPRGVKRK